MKLSDNKFFLIGASFLIGALFSYSIISLERSKDEKENSTSNIRDRSAMARKPRVARRKRVDTSADFAKRQQQIMKQMMKSLDQSLTLDMDIDIKGNMGLGSNLLEVSEYSDDKYRYVKLMADDIDEKSLKVKVSEGRIDISGEIRKEEQKSGAYGSSTSSYVSSFSKSFDVPRLVKEETAKITVQKGEVLIRFEKS